MDGTLFLAGRTFAGSERMGGTDGVDAIFMGAGGDDAPFGGRSNDLIVGEVGDDCLSSGLGRDPLDLGSVREATR